MTHLVKDLQAHVFLAAGFADDYWLSLPFALDAIAESLECICSVPGPAAVMVRFQAGGMLKPLRHAIDAFAAGDRAAVVMAIGALSSRSTDLLAVWNQAFPAGVQPVLLDAAQRPLPPLSMSPPQPMRLPAAGDVLERAVPAEAWRRAGFASPAARPAVLHARELPPPANAAHPPRRGLSAIVRWFRRARA